MPTAQNGFHGYVFTDMYLKKIPFFINANSLEKFPVLYYRLHVE